MFRVNHLPLYIALFLIAALLPFAANAGGPITKIFTAQENATKSQYTKGGQQYKWGEGKNLKITGFEFNNLEYYYTTLANRVIVRRNNNAVSSGDRCGMFAETTKSWQSFEYKASYPDDGSGTNNCDLAELMSGRIINRGVRDLFQNKFDPANPASMLWNAPKNIERVDFIIDAGITTPGSTIDLKTSGHVVTEKYGNNDLRIAAILSLDGAGDPDAYGPLVNVCSYQGCNFCDKTKVNACVNYGLTDIKLYSDFLQNEFHPPQSGVTRTSGQSGPVEEPIGMAFVSLEDLGLGNGQKYYGYSLFAPDVNSVDHTLTDHTTFPADTLGGEASSPGDADPYGGVAGFFTSTCDGLTGKASQISPAMNMQLSSSEKIFIPSHTIDFPKLGHLKAFSVNNNGTLAPTASWDVATTMTSAIRDTKLYSTNAAGTLTLFKNLDAAAFDIANPAIEAAIVAKVKNQVKDPSLLTNNSTSLLGSISEGNSINVIDNTKNMSLYLNSASYRSYYKGTIASRAKRVMLTSDDGFLYAFDQTDGKLKWGWIPRALVADLKTGTDFWFKQNMRGHLEVIDEKESGTYASFVVGSYKNGLGHFVLKLDSNGNLDSVLWDKDESDDYVSSPNRGKMDYFTNGSGTIFMTYVVTDSAGDSTLKIRKLSDPTQITSMKLNREITAPPFVMPDFGHPAVIAPKTVYIGDEDGDIYRAALLNSSGNLKSANNIRNQLNSNTNKVGHLGENKPILFLGASAFNLGYQYYLRTQSKERITILGYNKSTTKWDKAWTASRTTSGRWTSGSFSSSTDIKSLPSGAYISDEARIVAGSVIVPVSTLASTDLKCYRGAHYYFYSLSDGKFPTNIYAKDGSSQLSSHLHFGYGEAKNIQIRNIADIRNIIGYGSSDQTTDFEAKTDATFQIFSTYASGIMGWKELKQ